MERDGAEAPWVCRAGVKTAAGAKGRAEQAGRPGEERRAAGRVAFIGTTPCPRARVSAAPWCPLERSISPFVFGLSPCLKMRALMWGEGQRGLEIECNCQDKMQFIIW